MTKVLINSDLLSYQQAMKESLRQVIQENFVDGVREMDREEPPLPRKDLLPPPHIHWLGIGRYEGEIDDLIAFPVTADFGIHELRIRIQDEYGNLIESGKAIEVLDGHNFWLYGAEVDVPAGTNVIVQATAIDCMGGVGVKQERKTISKPGG